MTALCQAEVPTCVNHRESVPLRPELLRTREFDAFLFPVRKYKAASLQSRWGGHEIYL